MNTKGILITQQIHIFFSFKLRNKPFSPNVLSKWNIFQSFCGKKNQNNFYMDVLEAVLSCYTWAST